MCSEKISWGGCTVTFLAAYGGGCMLQVKNLTVVHKKDDRVLLEDFSFVLNKGDKIAIIGEEGNGKSTLLKLIVDDNLVEDYIGYRGEIIRNHLRIGYLPQEMPVEEKQYSIYEYMCENSLFYETEQSEIAQMSRQLHLPIDMFYSDIMIEKLSGGEKIKLQLAKLILSKPDVLCLDEPSNDLDIQTVCWLEDFIRNCELPILYISHDEMLLENTANKIIHLEQIKRKMKSRATVSKIGYKEYVSQRRSAILHQTQIAKKERSDYAKQQEKFRQIQQKVEHRQNAISRQDPHGGALLKKTMHRVKAYEARFEKEFENMTELPELEEAMFIKFGEEAGLPNGKVVLDFYLPELKVGDRVLSKNVSLYLRGPEKICIIGKNGCGKTTLLRQIAEDLKLRGDIKVSYMPQNYEECLDLSLTPIEFLTVDGSKEENSRIRTYLGSMKYTPEEMNHAIGNLSGGQKAKLLLLQMSICGSNVLILDEPTRNFSALSNPVIRQVLKNFQGAIISISHDRKYIEEVAEKVYKLTEKGLELIKE